MPLKTRIALLSISIVGLATLGFAGRILFQWVSEGRFSDETLVGSRLVVFGLGVVAIAGSAPFAAFARKLAWHRTSPPEEIAGQIIGIWLLANSAAAALSYIAVSGSGVTGRRLLVVWLVFAIGSIPAGLRQASRRWAFAERMREAQDQIERTREESALRTKEHDVKMATMRAEHAETMKQLEGQTRQRVSSPWYKAYTGRW